MEDYRQIARVSLRLLKLEGATIVSLQWSQIFMNFNLKIVFGEWSTID